MSSKAKHVQARSIATRDKLVAATLDVIYDRGYNQATTNEFAERAGMSRGALLHHFPARSNLILAAMEHLLNEGTRDIRDMAEQVSRDAMDLNDFIEFLWGMFSGRFFYLSIEFINEARTDAELRQKMLPVVRKFHEALDGIWANLQAVDGHLREAQILLNLTVCLMRGMGVQTVLKHDPAYFHDLIDAWKNILPDLMTGQSHGLMFPSAAGDNGNGSRAVYAAMRTGATGMTNTSRPTSPSAAIFRASPNGFEPIAGSPFEMREVGLATASSDRYTARQFRVSAGGAVTQNPHWHDADFQYLHILRGEIDFKLEEVTTTTLSAGDSIWLPKGCVHCVTRVSADLEFLEIFAPADVATVAATD